MIARAELTADADESEGTWGVNERVQLDDPRAVWIVEAGVVAVLAVPIVGGEPGVGRYLFDVEGRDPALTAEPAALFGAPPRLGVGLLAVAVTEARVRRATSFGPGDRALLPGLSTRWLARLAATVAGDTPVQPPPADDAGPESLVEHAAAVTGTLLETLAADAESLLENERKRLALRARRKHRVLADAVASIRAVLSTDRAGAPVEPGSLSRTLTAMTEIGKVLGHPIRTLRGDVSFDGIARASRLRHRRVVLSGEWWRQDAGPLLARLADDRRPVALLPASRAEYALFDPSDGTRRRVDAELAESVYPVATMFYASFPEGPLTARPLAQSALRGRSRDVIVTVATGLLATLLGMIVPQATAILMDRAIPDGDTKTVVELGLALLLTALGSAAVQLVQALGVLRLEAGADATLQASVVDRVLTLPPTFFRGFTSGDLVMRVMTVRAIRQLLGVAAVRGFVSGALSVANVALLFYYSRPMALLAVLAGVLSSAATIGLGLAVRKRSIKLTELQGESFGLVVELINGISKIRVSGAEERAFRHWSKRVATQLGLRLESQRLGDYLTLFNGVLSPFSMAMLFVLGAQLLVHAPGESSTLLTGVFLAFSAAYGVFMAGMTGLSTSALSIFQARVLWSRTVPVLDAAPEVDSSKGDPGRLTGRIDLEGVSFRYRADGAMTLDGVTLHVQPGECVALVGPSGGGKLTLFRVLLGFEQIRTGRVLFDGQDLAGLDVEAVRRQLGVVLQNGRINAGSLLENIAGARELSLDDAWQAARDAGLEEDVKATMPMGLHTMINEGGTNLSGGQRQRLLIARALAQKPAILLFDEATSALDNRTQDIVTQSLDRLKITRILIAHRLSTIRRADRIYVIQEGRVAQSGTFDELMRSPGLMSDFLHARGGGA